MAIEKTLNTRLKLRYDSHENWMTNDPVLLSGEVALSTVSVKQDGNVNFVPSVLIKVGDGSHKYSELDFAFAKAADVVEAAKSEAGLKAFVNGVIADAGIATNDAMEALAGRVTTAEGEIDALQADLNTAETGLKARMTSLEGLVGDDKVSDQINAAIAALNLGETYAAKSHTHTKAEITDFAHGHVMTEITGLSDEFAKKVDKETGKSLIADAEIARLAAMSDGANKVEASTNGKIKIDGVDTTVYTHPDKHAMSEIDGLDTALAGKQDTIASNTYDAYGSAAQALADANAYTDDELERLVGTETVTTQISTALNNALKVDGADKYALATALAAEAETARDAEKANAEAITKLNANAETEGSVDYKIAQKFSTLMENPDEAMNSIQELVDWTTEHADDALEMSNQVTANKNDIAKLNGDASTNGSVAKKIADAIAAENLGQYATDGELSALAGRVTTVEGDLNAETTGLKARMTAAEGDIDALETKVGDKKVSEQISAVTDGLEDRIEALEAIDHEHDNKTVLDGIEAADITAWDAKVDSVTAAADSGLKATRTGNAVAIEIDDTVTFIFDCGDSGVTA